MRIHLINLERSTDRLRQFLADNSHLRDVLRFVAVDGNQVTRVGLVEQRIADSELPEYTAGAIGAALSHLSLWEKAAKEDVALTIAEDDAVFNAGFEVEAERVIASLGANWDFVLWGWNFDSYLLFEFLPGASPCLAQFDQPQLRSGLTTFQQLRIAAVPYRLSRAFGIVCYSISPQGARKLLEYCVPLRDMHVWFWGLNESKVNNGIDIMMNASYPQINAYVSFPPLVVTRNDTRSSTVQGLPADAALAADVDSAAPGSALSAA